MNALLYFRDFHGQWSLVLGVSLLLWCHFWVNPRFGSLPAALFGYLALSALWVWVWKFNRYLPVNPYDQMALRYFASDSLGKIMLILVPMMALAEDRERMLVFGKAAASSFLILESLLILISFSQGCYGRTNECGGLGNPSIIVGLLVCTLPLIVHSWKQQWIALVLAAFAIFVSKSSIAIGLLAVYVGLWFFPWDLLRERAWARLQKYVLLIAGGMGAIFGAAYLILGAELFNDSERFMIWKFMMIRWTTPWNIPTGTGLGTYHVFSINLQSYGHKTELLPIGTENWWITLHNEPLQILFECGIIGFVLFAAVYMLSLKRLIEQRQYAVALSALLYGVYMSLNPALHNPLPALFGAFLFVYALRRTNTLEETL